MLLPTCFIVCNVFFAPNKPFFYFKTFLFKPLLYFLELVSSDQRAYFSGHTLTDIFQICRKGGQSSGAVGSIAISQLQGPQLDTELRVYLHVLSEGSPFSYISVDGWLR